MLSALSGAVVLEPELLAHPASRVRARNKNSDRIMEILFMFIIIILIG
jgi:hypothetical protein